MNKKYSIKILSLVFLGFGLFYFLMFSLEKPVNIILCSEQLSTWTLTSSRYYTKSVHNVLCSDFDPSQDTIKTDPNRRPQEEYTVKEQLSKFYLFMIILISGYAYQTFKKPIDINLSICFFILGLTMYLSESNMISNNPQLVFALIILPLTVYTLAKKRAWPTILLLFLGFCVISGGILLDYTHQHKAIKSLVPGQLLALMEKAGEERFDVTGLAIICMSVVFCFLDPIKEFVRNNVKGALGVILSAGLIASGNGFLHFQYDPGRKLQLFAFILSLSGWLGLILTNKFISKKDRQLYILDENLYYSFFFIFFVMLPTVYGVKNENLISVVLWLPLLTFIAFTLYRRHPCRNIPPTIQNN